MIISVSILLATAGSIFTVLGEYSKKTFLPRRFGFFILRCVLLKIISIVFFFYLKCLICNLNFMNDETLNYHYIWYTSSMKIIFFFQDLFSPDNNLRSCDKCMMYFGNGRLRKNHMFLLHYNQTGSSRTNQQLPANVLHREWLNISA